MDFCQVVLSLVQDYDIQDLKKLFPDFGEFLFLHVVPCPLDRSGEGIVLFDVAAVKFSTLDCTVIHAPRSSMFVSGDRGNW